MRRFLASFKFPLLVVLILAIATTAAYAMLQPSGADISNAEMVRIFKIGGWFSGLVFGLLTLLSIGILNLLRRIFRMRQVFLLHAPVVFLGILPWLIFSWQLVGEPRYMNIAKAIIDFVARPLLWGSLVAMLFVVIMILLSPFLRSQK